MTNKGKVARVIRIHIWINCSWICTRNYERDAHIVVGIEIRVNHLLEGLVIEWVKMRINCRSIHF